MVLSDAFRNCLSPRTAKNRLDPCPAEASEKSVHLLFPRPLPFNSTNSPKEEDQEVIEASPVDLS